MTMYNTLCCLYLWFLRSSCVYRYGVICLCDSMAAFMPFSHDQLCTLSGVHEFPISIAAPDNSRIEAQGSLQGPGITLRRVSGRGADWPALGSEVCTDSLGIVLGWATLLQAAPSGTRAQDTRLRLGCSLPPHPGHSPGIGMQPRMWLPLAPASRTLTLDSPSPPHAGGSIWRPHPGFHGAQAAGCIPPHTTPRGHQGKCI